MKKVLQSLSVALVAILFSSATYAETITISDDGSGTGTTTWTADNTYLLDGFVFVNDGQTLTIEAGTVIKGMPGTGADASALVVARGGKIYANGTADAPIIFTFEGDALDGSTPYDTQGQWGGVIVLGNAGLNSIPGETQIEGIPETEPRGLYGGDNDADDSGSITYISIRHGGTDIGAGNEINGLTLGGVGSSTVIEHIEVISNQDDGMEVFGGAAQVKWIVTAFCGDDSFDYDEGWVGKGQFWCTVQDPNGEGTGDRGGEHDGGTDPEDGAPYAHPVIYNATYIGRGIDAGKRALTFRDNAGGEYHNSVFVNWGKGIDVENLSSGEDSYNRLSDGDLAFAGNIFYDVASEGTAATAADLFKITMGTGGWADESDSTAQATASTDAFEALFASNNNEVMNPELVYNEVGPGTYALNVVPQGDVDGGTAPSDAFYTAVEYRGAFEPNQTFDNWMKGWTYLDQLGFLVETVESVSEEFVADFSVFPNPSNGEYNIVLPEGMNNARVQIVDVTGLVVLTKNMINQNDVISLTDQARGVYFMTVLTDSVEMTKQLIKY